MTNALAQLDSAVHALAEARDLSEVKQIIDIAQAAVTYAKAAKMGLEAQNYAAVIKISAECKAGEMLAQLKRGEPGRPNKKGNNVVTISEYAETLRMADITQPQASRMQMEAAVPEAERNAHIAEVQKNGKEVTTTGVLKLAKTLKQEQRRTDANTANGASERGASIRLYQDDALLRLPQLPDDSLALVVADPPYNVTGYDWDRIGSESEYLTWTDGWLTALRPKLKAAYHLFVFCDPDYVAALEMLLRRQGWPLKSRVIWEYRNLVKGRDVADKFIENWQMCFHCGTHALNWPSVWTDSRFMVQQHAAPQSNFNEGKNHPMAKPLDLIKLLVNVGSKSGDTILDPFAGGGTTGKAAVEVGQRQCVLIEREDLYCGEIEKRLGILREPAEVLNG